VIRMTQIPNFASIDFAGVAANANAASAQPWMTPHPAPRAGVAIQVQAVSGHEPGQIPGGCALQAGAVLRLRGDDA